MTAADGIAIVSIITSAILGGYSTWLYHKARGDAMGEEMYGQQLDFLKKLRGRFAELDELFLKIKIDGFLEEDFNKAAEHLTKMDVFIEANSFLLPDKIVTYINDSFEAANDYLDLMADKQAALTKDCDAPYYQALYIMEIELRDFVGVDALSEKNKHRIGMYNNK